MTIINITENNNILDFTSTYSPIVCGNSNYALHFEFSEIWKKCLNKIAIFVVDGKKAMVAFEGNSVRVPAMPNADFVFVSLISGDGEEQLTTTALKIRLVPTSANNKCAEFEQISGSVAEMLGVANKFINGDQIVKVSEKSNQVIGKNLLVNSNFKINQRGLSTYAGTNIYTVDRWRMMGTGTVDVLSSGVKFSATDKGAGIRQHIERPSIFSGQDVCFSVNAMGEAGFDVALVVNGIAVASASETNSEKATIVLQTTLGEIKDTDAVYVKISTTGSNKSFEVYWTKLEFGKYASKYVPNTYAEEIELCRRFYRRYASQVSNARCVIASFWAGSTVGGFALLDIGTPMRESLTINYSSLNDIQYSAGKSVGSPLTKMSYGNIASDRSKISLYCEGEFVSGTSYHLQLSETGWLELDCEMF